MLAFYLSLIDSEENKNLFEMLYIEHRKTLVNVAYNILRDKYLAEDAVHDAFVLLANNIDKISDRNCDDRRNYLIIIVKNVALTMYNKRKKEFCSYESELDLDDEEMLEDVELKIESIERQEWLYKMIKKLDSKYADVLILRYYYDKIDREIAEELGISYNNAKIRILRAKQKLKQLIAEEDKNDKCGI